MREAPLTTGIDHTAVGILARAMQSMAIRGFIVHDRESGAYALTDSRRATLAMILKNAGVNLDQFLQQRITPVSCACGRPLGLSCCIGGRACSGSRPARCS